MDRQADPELLAQVRKLALEVPGVRGVEKLFIRKSGLEHFVDIHVEVAPEISVREGHEIGHAVKDRLIAQIITVMRTFFTLKFLLIDAQHACCSMSIRLAWHAAKLRSRTFCWRST
jgi:divalent metal cation (Fe/Co/Zn/Cd) transporter